MKVQTVQLFLSIDSLLWKRVLEGSYSIIESLIVVKYETLMTVQVQKIVYISW